MMIGKTYKTVTIIDRSKPKQPAKQTTSVVGFTHTPKENYNNDVITRHITLNLCQIRRTNNNHQDVTARLIEHGIWIRFRQSQFCDT